jgi:hypothetical protein
MDQWIATFFPGSVKSAIDDLMAEWSKPEAPTKP